MNVVDAGTHGNPLAVDSILSGYRIYHNYIRPHEALEGKTPSEKAGIEIKGMDKWLTIIQNASRRCT